MVHSGISICIVKSQEAGFARSLACPTGLPPQELNGANELIVLTTTPEKENLTGQTGL